MELTGFLQRLTQGLPAADLPQPYHDLLDNLLLLKAVKEKDGVYILDSKYRFGIIDISRNGKGYLSPLTESAGKDLIVEPNDLNRAGKGDIVLAKRLFSRGRPKAKVIEVLKRAFVYTLAYTVQEGAEIVVRNIRTDLPVRVAASQKELDALPAGSVLKIESASEQIAEVLGVIDDPKVDEKISLALYNKHEAFPPACEEEARRYGDSVDRSAYPDRTDLTHLPFCTIDPPDAKDFDDAICFDVANHTLYVAIADVSAYVTEDSALDKEAAVRGFTIYFPHKSIPMLPRALSENICSLKPEEDRLAFVYKITLDPQTLQSRKEELIEGIIHSRRRYTYDRIDRFLEGDFSGKDATDDEILSFLLPLQKLLSKIRHKRLQSGCEFRNEEVRMQLDENQNLVAVRVEKETPSHALIEDAMLLANKAAAKALEKGIFRTHDRPSEERIDELLDDLSLIGIYSDEKSENIYAMIRALQRCADEKGIREEVDKLIIRAQKQAVYSHEDSGHFGLGFEHYTHFTSPIRRYSDLIVHRLLRAIRHGDTATQEAILRDIDVTAARVSELEREAAKVAWDFMDRKFARYADAHRGEAFRARITDNERTPIVHFEEGLLTGARAFLLDHDTQRFAEAMVEITEVHIPQAKIIGRIREYLEQDV